MGGEVTLVTTVVVATFVALPPQDRYPLYRYGVGSSLTTPVAVQHSLISGHPSIIILTCIPIFSTLDYGKLSSFLDDFNLF